MHKLLLTTTAALLVSAGAAAPAQAQNVNAGGSSFVAPLMDKWIAVYMKGKEGKINYVSVGSGAGIKGLLDETYEFACSDAPLTDKQLEVAKEKGGTIVHVPVALGGIVPVYNLEGLDKPLRLSGRVLADIFAGKVQKWNDDAIKELNAGVALPDKNIAVVRRADASGSTYIFTDYLSKVNGDFEKSIGHGTIVKWPDNTVAAKGNEGVAALVKQTPGAIGYVDLLYALKNKLTFAAVKNKDGNYVLGSLETVTAAAEGALNDLPADLRFSLTNAPGKDAYPIAGCTWALLFAKQNEGRGQRVVDFVKWAIGPDGQEYNTDLYYARLPKGLAQKTEELLKGVTVGK